MLRLKEGKGLEMNKLKQVGTGIKGFSLFLLEKTDAGIHEN